LFRTLGFEREILNGTRRIETALALVLGDLIEGAPLLRVHSQCLTGEVLGSLRCDCNEQLEVAMRAIAEEGRGLVIYEYQEGRGIGLMAKLTAKRRNALPKNDFAGPDRSYPVEDKSHARNALARASQFGTSNLKAKVRAKVHRKYPDIQMHMDGGAVKSRLDRSPRK